MQLSSALLKLLQTLYVFSTLFSSFYTLCEDDDATPADLVSPTLGTSNKVRPGKLIFHIVSVWHHLDARLPDTHITTRRIFMQENMVLCILGQIGGRGPGAGLHLVVSHTENMEN